MVPETAVGNEGEEESSLYHVKTKSRTISIRISLTAADMTAASGTRGGSD